MKYLGTNQANLQKNIYQFYPDGNFTIDFSDLFFLMTKQIKKSEEKLFKDIKQLYINVDGPITDDKIEDAIKFEENLTDEEVSEMLRDANADGKFN